MSGVPEVYSCRCIGLVVDYQCVVVVLRRRLVLVLSMILLRLGRQLGRLCFLLVLSW